MDLVQTILLALIQGVTEFLPISSSAHLILPTAVLGWPDQGLAFDTAVHLGTLLAVLWFFRNDIQILSIAVTRHLFAGESSEHSRLGFNLIIASLPIIPVGFAARFAVESYLRATEVIIATTILFAFALWWADRVASREKTENSLTWQQALFIGIGQCLALIPGTSRSGITMTCALLSGFTREAAARISFLISIPVIAGAATVKLFDLATATEPVDWESLLIGGAIAALSAYLCIWLFLDFISRIGFLPFVIYRLILGVILLILVI